MLYSIYETNKRALQPVSQVLSYLSKSMEQVEMLFPANPAFNIVKAQTEWLSEFTKTYPKPSFNINTINLKGKIYEVKEEIVIKKTFCDVIHFKKTDLNTQQPTMLIVAPLSGHYATLLRDTVNQTLNDFDVYVTDWLDPSDIPLEAGDFGFDDYVQYVADFISELKQKNGTCDVLAVCQPTVPVLAATAYLEKTSPENSPNSVTVMGGPIDTRKTPTEVNKYALKNDINWFKKNVLFTVPFVKRGAGRLVYPGFLQHFGFLSMNVKKHTEAHLQFFNHLLEGCDLSIQKHKDFYDEYNAVMDLPAKYYIETLERVFMDQQLAKGTLMFKNHLISLSDIHNVKILAIEGENDDISGRDQTFSVLELTNNLSENKKGKYLAEKVGHYGVFSGRRWREFIYPKIVDFVITSKEDEKTQPLKNALQFLNKEDVAVEEVTNVVEESNDAPEASEEEKNKNTSVDMSSAIKSDVEPVKEVNATNDVAIKKTQAVKKQSTPRAKKSTVSTNSQTKKKTVKLDDETSKKE